MKQKNWLIIVASVSLTLLLFVGALNYIIDPLQHYRKATWYKTCFCEDGRYLNPGLARHFDYDSIIIGTCMTENFIPSYIHKKLGINAMKLPIQCASGYEENLVMETAISTGKVKHVIYGMDFDSFKGDAKRQSYGAGSMPVHLYDTSYLNDYKYLLNLDTLINQGRHSLAATIFNRSEKLDIDMAYYWGKYFTFSRKNALRAWKERKAMKKSDVEMHRFNVLKEHFDQNIMPHIRDNPQIQFYIFYPPYSILAWINTSEDGLLEDALAMNRYVFESTKRFKNVKIFNFQDAGDITLDLENYRDPTHYSPAINELIIDSIAMDAYLMTEENAQGHFDRLREQIREYEVKLLKKRG